MLVFTVLRSVPEDSVPPGVARGAGMIVFGGRGGSGLARWSAPVSVCLCVPGSQVHVRLSVCCHVVPLKTRPWVKRQLRLILPTGLSSSFFLFFTKRTMNIIYVE